MAGTTHNLANPALKSTKHAFNCMSLCRKGFLWTCWSAFRETVRKLLRVPRILQVSSHKHLPQLILQQRLDMVRTLTRHTHIIYLNRTK